MPKLSICIYDERLYLMYLGCSTLEPVSAPLTSPNAIHKLSKEIC